ncbi:uncharacterized protein LOC62_02G001832 [Vanrija pseudolonga]|uniref:Uncharacterized protein n=1 Tax=Vanrija pseudolonga TaxID=143232 RepID=A0AAF1BG72_9TREE|nr:hypothetical protein LOC62_02G001832 [Vanrija pseudolonga]
MPFRRSSRSSSSPSPSPTTTAKSSPVSSLGLWLDDDTINKQVTSVRVHPCDRGYETSSNEYDYDGDYELARDHGLFEIDIVVLPLQHHNKQQPTSRRQKNTRRNNSTKRRHHHHEAVTHAHAHALDMAHGHPHAPPHHHPRPSSPAESLKKWYSSLRARPATWLKFGQAPPRTTTTTAATAAATLRTCAGRPGTPCAPRHVTLH